MSSFKSFLFSAQGKAASPMGTFGTSRRQDLGRSNGGCGADAIYDVDVSRTKNKGSRGVARTNPRFVALTDECSPGPAYMPQENLCSRPGPKFSSAPRFPDVPKKKKKKANRPNESDQNATATTSASAGGGDKLLTSTSASNRSYARKEADISSSFTSEGYKGTVSKSMLAKGSTGGAACTFGIRPSSNPRVETSGYINPPTILESMPAYKGRWRSASPVDIDEEAKKEERHKHEELMAILRKGANRSMEYNSSTPSYSMSYKRRPPSIRDITPGPGSYNVAKYNPKGDLGAPTMSRAPLSVLPGAKGVDSPGPALYSQLRHIQ